jgi:DNA polymerase III epsilon subunit-like protein
MGMIVPQSAGSRPLGAALTFVAIDFETADHGPDSACAVGLVRVSGAEIVERKYYLIRPPRSSFLAYPVCCQYDESVIICRSGLPRLSNNASRFSAGFSR